jgi:hypothetical protein
MKGQAAHFRPVHSPSSPRSLTQQSLSICTIIGGEEVAVDEHKPPAAADRLFKFPARPETHILSESIPPFFIARNRVGLWVAREAEGRTGGVFLFKKSALRFAKKNSGRSGCATMFLAERLELDVELRTRLSASDPIARETAQSRMAVASKAWHSAGRIHELANGPRKNRTGSLRLAAGCRRGPGNVSTKVQRLATQRATKRNSFGSLRLRHICEPSRFGDAHDRGPSVRVFPHKLLKIRPAQHQKLAICNRNHVSLPDSTR